ncbi:MAG: tat (twin-arginine translocation) pathway signal sequence [Denitrovibrio sp.]|nr:MAG: tat (twin-arginine translocation) pathway signal sequence [Denitrovibrio sp.]
MDRRDFLKKAMKGTVAAGVTAGLGKYGKILEASPLVPYDLVAVKGGEPDVMFDMAMQSFGGMGQFVPKGSRVLVKPNIGWDVSPERAGNTNPVLVAQIVKHCLDAGAKEVSVFDHSCDHWVRCYKNSGIEKAVKDAGGRVVSGDSKSYYREVSIAKGERLTEASVHELYLDSDVVINVPVLKHHSSTMVTIGMKNLMGVVWDRFHWHRNDLHQCIADFASFRKPDLTVVDAYNVMMRNGPRGVYVSDVAQMKSLIVSPDPVAADTAAAMLFGADPEDIRHIQIAHAMKIGTSNLKSLKIDRIKL